MSSFLRDTVQENISEGQNDISKDSCRRVYMIRPDEDKKKDPKRSFAKVIELNASSKVQDSQDKSLITPSANLDSDGRWSSLDSDRRRSNPDPEIR